MAKVDKTNKKENPEGKANLLSKITLWSVVYSTPALFTSENLLPLQLLLGHY